MAKTDAVFSELVSEGLALIAALEAQVARRNAAAADLANAQAALDDLNARLVALGVGRYRDSEDHTCLVVAAIPQTLSPDRFALPVGAEASARAIAGDFFLKLFDRKVLLTPTADFAGVAKALLKPSKARDLTALCIIPGKLAGGRCAHVRWPALRSQ